MNERSALRDRRIDSIWPCLTKRTTLDSLVLSSAAGNEGTNRPSVFTTTRWSLILSGANSKGVEKDARAALAELCRIYWPPILAFVSRPGYSATVSWDAWVPEAPSQMLNSWPEERLFDVQ